MPIEGASLIAGKLAILSLKDVASVVKIHSLDGKFEREAKMPDLARPAGSLADSIAPRCSTRFVSDHAIDGLPV
jgi:hypothetical protein